MDVLRDTVVARDLIGRLVVADARYTRYRLREYEDGRMLLEPVDPSVKADERAGVRAALGRLGLGVASAPSAGAEGAAAAKPAE